MQRLEVERSSSGARNGELQSRLECHMVDSLYSRIDDGKDVDEDVEETGMEDGSYWGSILGLSIFIVCLMKFDIFFWNV